jgi:hypothetical protein
MKRPGKRVVIARSSFSINLSLNPLFLRGKILRNRVGKVHPRRVKGVLSIRIQAGNEQVWGVIPETSGIRGGYRDNWERQMLYAAIDEEKGWKVLLSLPARTHRTALRIAVPGWSFRWLFHLLLSVVALHDEITLRIHWSIGCRADQNFQGRLETKSRLGCLII